MDDKIINGVVDMSSFLLVEGTADSEADYGILTICHDHVNISYDEDDAESCSCEYTSDQTLLSSDQEVSSCLEQDYEVDEESSEFNNGDHEGEQRWKGYKMWLRGNANLMAIDDDEAESKNGIHLSREVKDQMEDWLFWETCMAVGYP